MTKLYPKQKYRFKKKGTASPLKLNILSIQIFPPLRTTIKPNNHSIKYSYLKDLFQTRILHKKRYFKPPNKYPYKISYLAFFFLLLLFLFSSPPLLLLLSSLFLFFSLLEALAFSPNSKTNCLVLSHFGS